MPDASYLQTSFLGGEWSPLIQGRMDDQRYRTALNVMRNTLPIEEGSAVRRPGTHLIGPTRQGNVAVLRAFDFAESHPYNLELTAGHMRLIAGLGIVVESFGTQVVIGLSSGDPTVVQTATAHGWSTGDEVIAQIETGQLNSSIAALLGRQLVITVVDTTHFSVADSVTGAPIDGTSMVLGSSDVTVTRIADFVTPYAENDLQAINQVQDQSDLLLLHTAYPPQAVISTSPEQGTSFAVFTFGEAVFKDGPYLDPPTDGTTITPSGVSGSVTLTLAGGSTRFAATDVGRMVRLFSEPDDWSAATNYAIGDQVKFNNAYYQAIKANSNKEPDADVINWGVSTSAAVWNWAIITAFTDTTHVTATLEVVVNADGTNTPGPVLPRTSACKTWRLGLFSETTGYPSCGTYHEGRLWLSGTIGNRLDGGVSNDFFNFSPTGWDGTVADDNACDYVFNAKDVNEIFWMEPDALGMICGTQAGEWLVQASSTNDTLTPTSVQAHRRTNYGCANVPAKRTGLTIAFVQRYNKKLLEYITTDFRGLAGRNIAITGKHLTQEGIVEIAYQSEKVPTIWARTEAGSLLSCTYKRESPYASDPPNFAGWAHHDLGNGLTVESIQAGPNFDGSLDALTVIVSDGSKRWVNIVTDLFDVDWQIGDANFVDFSETPSMWEIITGPPLTLRLYSLHYLAGHTVDVFAGGIDCGQIAVAADGHLDIPIDTNTIPLLTSTWLASLSSSVNFHGLGIAIVRTPAPVANSPTVTGIANFDTSLLASYAGGISGIDWDGGRFFIYDSAAGHVQVNDITTLKVKQPPISSHDFDGGMKYCQDGFLYGATGATNAAHLNKVDPVTMQRVAQFGLATSSFPTTSNTWAFPRDFDTVTSPSTGESYLISTSLVNTVNEIAVMNLSNVGDRFGEGRFFGPGWTGFSLTMDEGRGVVTHGKPVRGMAQGWVLSLSGPNGFHGIQLGLYRILCLPGGLATGYKVATLNTNIFGVGFNYATNLQGILLDETDGNIILHLNRSNTQAWSNAATYNIGDIVTNAGHDFISLQGGNLNHTPTVGGTAFWQDLGASSANSSDTIIAKMNVKSGAVMWQNTISNTIPGIGNLNASRIRHGKYCFKDCSGTSLHQINTLTGVDTTTPIISVLYDYQFYNDTTGELIGDTQYTNGGGSPTPIGSTPTGWTHQWAVLGPAAGPPVPAITPPGDGVIWQVPVAIGYGYPSQGQILRAINPQEAGAANGPALAKTRRSHMFGSLLFETQGIEFGTDFSHMRPALFRDTNDETEIPLTLLYSNVHWDSLDDTYSFDSMLCWQVTRPYPATVCSLGAFIHSQDR